MKARFQPPRFVILVLALLALSPLFVWAMRPVVTRAVMPDPVTAAWERARATGSYNFTSDVTQVTLPLATITNVGRTSRTDRFYLKGQNDLAAARMEMTLWSEGGSVLQAESGVSIRSEGGKTYARRGDADWEVIDDVTGSIAPQGDFMNYLAALKNIEAQPTETRGGVNFTRYTFEIDSPRFAVYMHRQMEATLRARGELPATLELEVPAYFREMVGSGELWVGEDGLPLRQILTLQFPPQKDDQVHSQIVVDYSNYGALAPVAATTASSLQSWLGAAYAPLVDNGLIPAARVLPLLALALLLIYYRRTRLLYITVTILVIFSQVAGPLLTTFTNIKFVDAQSAKAAAQEERQLAAQQDRDVTAALGTVDFNPHLSPLEAAAQTQDSVDTPVSYSTAMLPASAAAPAPVPVAAPLAQLIDDGVDTDGDLLSDFTEARLGTSAVNSDTDTDGLDDGIEVNGFDFGGQHWYTDPLETDSNRDGQIDGLEWGFTGSTLNNTPLDTDGDGFPDLFDNDNDGDGVPDNKDLAPFAKGAATYTEAAPLQLTLNDLTAGKPAFVEFQIRPQDEKQLWFAFNVLDWPQDSAGQMRDIDNGTYADVAAAAGRTADASESNGDMKLLPMLEIRMPTTGANLPPQADLTPFNITVNNLTANGNTKVAYIPLNIVTDEKTGQRVGFSAQMRYLPTGNWPSPHQVRLVWVVQALVDLPCDKTADASADCQADGYLNNVPQMIQSYYSNWSLTGMNVREEHGTDMAIVYEDPAVDANKQDDAALWALTMVLDRHFTVARDTNHDNRRDLTLADLPARFDRDNNPTDAQRMDVPNTLQVVSRAYSTLDAAIATTTMTETGVILNNVFKPDVTNNRQIMPLLLFAQEQRTRQLTLSLLAGGGGYVAQNGTSLTLDMAPGGASPAQTVDVVAGVKWMAYCAPATGPVTFTPCDDDVYWEQLDKRYSGLPAQPEDQADDWMTGRLQFAQLYYTALRSGFYMTVQAGSTIPAVLFPLEAPDATASAIRGGLRGVATVPFLAGLHFTFIYPAGSEGTLLEWATQLHKAVADAQKMIERGANRGYGDGQGAVARVKSDLKSANSRLRSFRTHAVAAALSVLQVTLQILSYIPEIPAIGRTVLGAISFALNAAITVVMPAWMLFKSYSAVSFIQLLNGTATVSRAMRVGGAVGAIISGIITWGFFIYGAVAGGLTVGSPALNRAFFESVAATIVTVLLFALALNPIGLIISAIIGVVDFLLNLICELGVKELRTVPGMDGGCFTLTGSVIKYLTKLLYSYDLMINMDRTDLMVTGAPGIQLADPSKGFVAGNQLNVTLPVTTTVVHKDPDPSNGVLIYPYMYLFSTDNIKLSAFQYSLTGNGNATPPVTFGGMKDRWQNVRHDHTYLVSPMYRGEMSSQVALNNLSLPVGINQSIPVTINMSFAVPAYECWLAVIIPVCYPREFKGDNHMPINSLKYDILPATFAGFLALGSKPDGGIGQTWDAAFPSLRDADGDGLRSLVYKGMDPNDTTVDADGDGLTDRFELEQQVNGKLVSPIQVDTDADGLTDYQELRLATDPASADSDNDGLKDGEEVYHLHFDPTTGAPTTSWEGGWDVEINAAVPFIVRVSSDPLNADSDGDGLSDQAERQLAQDATPANRVDNQNRPYHPQVPNTPPLAVLIKTDDFDGFLAPGQSFGYTTTVVANTAVAPGVLNVSAPAIISGAANPLALAFNPATFALSQTVTQSINLTVNSGVGTQPVRLGSTVNTRLPDSGALGWAFGSVTPEVALGGISAPAMPLYSHVAANRADRQDSFYISALALDDIGSFGAGDILAYSIPAGTVRALENDQGNTTAYMSDGPSTMATNTSSDVVAVWGQRSRCNIVSFNSLKVVTAGPDSAGSGIEPFIAFKPANGAEEQIWYWNTAGGSADMTSGQQRGPSAFGFPITRPFCGGPGEIKVYESDGSPSIPAQNELVANAFIDTYVPFSGVRTFTGAGHTIEVNITVPQADDYLIAGTLLESSGQITRTLTFPRPSSFSTNREIESFAPAVASDGNGFLVAYEAFVPTEPVSLIRFPQLVVQAFDRNGNAAGTNHRDLGSLQVGATGVNNLDVAVAWIGDRYRVLAQDRRDTAILMADVSTSGAFLTEPSLVTLNALTGAGHPPSLAYDPISGRTLLIYLSGSKAIVGHLYQGDTLLTDSLSLALAQFPTARSPKVVWNPNYQGWLLSYQDDAASQRHVFVPLDQNGDLTFSPITGFFRAATDNSLACPVPQSAPLTTLRFEELPGATAFVDASGRGNHASCTGAACPVAGLTGAPNAPLSDYAVRFDGIDDGLTINRTFQDDFSVAFWLKAPQRNGLQTIVDGGDFTTTGFRIGLNNGGVNVRVPNVGFQTNRIDDDQWHFVVVTRKKSTGRADVYIDGAAITGLSGITNLALNNVADLRIGKLRDGTQPLLATIDNLQIFGATLSLATVQAMYNRTQQAYCVAAGVLNSNIEWAKVTANQQDTRGGRISAANGISLTIDSDLPTAAITSVQNNVLVGAGQVIGGSAADATSGIGQVEVSINNGAWQLATGTYAWSFSLAGLNGNISLRVRATDYVGNVGNPSSPLTLKVDGVAPIVTVNLPAGTIKPTKNAQGNWLVNLTGTANDANGIRPDSLQVRLEQRSGVGMPQTQQQASLNGANWSLDYTLDPGLFDPTGFYSVTVRALDNVDNAATPATGVLRLDVRGPSAVLQPADATRQVISQTITIGGVVSDTESIAGIDKLEIAFTPVAQIAALPAGLTGAEAEAQLNRVWTPVTLAQRGAGVATTNWSYKLPTGLEDLYQIDLRGTDMLGNVAINANLWRGTIDTTDPRLVMTATNTGVTTFDGSTLQRRYAIRFVCAAVDRNLNEATFDCPGEAVAEPVRSFESIPQLQALFPDLTIRSGLALSYTLWLRTATPSASMRACDRYGRCATTNAVPGAAAALQAPATDAPSAVIVTPGDGSVVAAGQALSMTVAAEAAASLKTVTVRLDGVIVHTLDFAQSEAVTMTQRTLTVNIANEGVHTLVAQATDWAGATQSDLFPVTFTLDQAAPTVSIDDDALTVADTWQPQSGILRFSGQASDSIGLAAVQVRVDNGEFVDATFGNGLWRTALATVNPDGRTLAVTVRARDRAGRVTEVTQEIATALSAADAPNTNISSGPAASTNQNTASFVFTGSPSAVAFMCQLDAAAYQPCASPQQIADLSKGSHTFRVRAIDSRGFGDLTPAAHTWTVTGSQPDVTLTGKPAATTTEHAARFTFTGGTGAARFECALDGAAYSTCTSPINYPGLSDGEHTFLVRALTAANKAGTAERFVWVVNNAVPVAADQSVTTGFNQAKNIVLTATDDEPLLYTVVTPPLHGVLSGVAPAVSYAPDTNYHGEDSFGFSVSDGKGGADTATVTIEVTPGSQPVESTTVYLPATMRVEGATAPDAAVEAGNPPAGNDLFLPLVQE